MILEVHQATEADAQGIGVLGEEMRSALLPGGQNYAGTEEHRERLFHFLLANGFLGVATLDGKPVGLLGAAPLEVWWSPRTFCAQECMFWVSPHARKHGAATALLNAAEEWARSIGLTKFMMTSDGDYMFHVLGQFYRSRGYRRTMTTYAKELRNG
jgi:GNAT superfamily N-acetyltransferase